MKRAHNRERGFTLVELMISLVLFSFAIAGVLAIAVSMAQGYREQRQIVETETAARGALEYIADALRQASPAVATANLTTSNANPSGPNLVIGNIEDLGVTVVATGACEKGAISVHNNSGPNSSDILEITFASGAAVTSLGAAWDLTGSNNPAAMVVNDISNLAVGDRVLVTKGPPNYEAHVVKINTITAGVGTSGTLTVDVNTCAKSVAANYLVGSLVVRVMRARFYLGTPFDGIPTVLMMDPDGDGSATAEPLADYVEDFQVAAGVDADLDDLIDSDEWLFSGVAGTPTNYDASAAPIEILRAIRLTVVVRAAQTLAATSATFKRPKAEDHAAAGAFDTYRRRVLTSVVDIRNLTGSPQ